MMTDVPLVLALIMSSPLPTKFGVDSLVTSESEPSEAIEYLMGVLYHAGSVGVLRPNQGMENTHPAG